MRAYKFLNAKYGLKSIKEKRLKQSRVKDLNDPFELMPYDCTDFVLCQTFLKTKDDVDKERGLLCFSSDWDNPVIWAHYSDKHQGMCLGFEIPKISNDPMSDVGYVKYVAKLLSCPSIADFDQMSDLEHTAFSRAAIFTKFAHWEYEKEIRVWSPLRKKEGSLYFVPFDENLKLVEIIVGQNCEVSKAEIVAELGPTDNNIAIRKARRAYDKFAMIEDESW